VGEMLGRSSSKQDSKWIAAISDYVKEVIRLKGGNEYKEGRKKRQEKVAIY
jgi:hypothetical protein